MTRSKGRVFFGQIMYSMSIKRHPRGVRKLDFMKLLPHLFEAAYIVDENRKILYCNDMFERITGYKKDALIGKYCHENIMRHVTEDGDLLCHDGCPLHDSLHQDNINSAQVYLHHKNGHRVPVTVKTIPFFDEASQSKKAIEIFTDYQKDSVLYEENVNLKKKVLVDALTQLYNRNFIDYQLDVCINEFDTFGTPLGVLFIDIDHFKSINDTYGHDVGDVVLTTVAKTLSANIRQFDFAGRYGGEEFIVLLRNVSVEGMRLIAEKLRLLIETTSTKANDKETIQVTVSIGCGYYQKGMTKEAFIKQADELMYLAKQQGRNKVIYR